MSNPTPPTSGGSSSPGASDAGTRTQREGRTGNSAVDSVIAHGWLVGCLTASFILMAGSGHAQTPRAGVPTTAEEGVNVSGVFPHLAAVAGNAPRTEAGVGALMPWAERLWFVTYVAHTSTTGSGTGLYEIDENLRLRKHEESVVGTYANRLVHAPTTQLVIGPHVVDTLANVRTIRELVDHRLAATMEHLTDPANKVYFLAMDGPFFEVDLRTLEVTELFDLITELDLPPGSKPHFKDAFTAHGRVIVANNTYDQRDYDGTWQAGRLAEWDGSRWTIVDRRAFTEVWSPKSFGNAVYATGWDNASVILKIFTGGRWSDYRLPKGSHTWDHTSATEWMRIREVETERALMDVHGIFYELPYHAYGGHIPPIRPIARHLRVVPDFASWRGMLVLAGNQATPMEFNGVMRNPTAGQPQAGLWFGKTDDLWAFGRPTGAGAVWRNTAIRAGECSDPFLMSGFDHKVLHLRHDASQGATFTVEVDFLGDGSWASYTTVRVPGTGYAAFTFPPGFSAEWVRVRVDRGGVATAHFIYS
jgi:hypothetical protein